MSAGTEASALSAAGVRAVPAPPGPAWVGTLLFVAAETMVFAGLVFAALVHRLWSPVWPPTGEPRLPLALALLNTSVLLASGITMRRAVAAARAGSAAARAWLGATTALGALFLAGQGGEWARLLADGFTARGPYAGFFYALVGLHAAHVLGGVVWLAGATLAARRRPPAAALLEAGALYWSFVVGVWLALFLLIHAG